MSAGRRRGEHQGRKPKLNVHARQDVIDSVVHGAAVKDLARRYNVNVATIYRVLAEARAGVEVRPKITRKEWEKLTKPLVV